MVLFHRLFHFGLGVFQVHLGAFRVVLQLLQFFLVCCFLTLKLLLSLCQLLLRLVQLVLNLKQQISLHFLLRRFLNSLASEFLKLVLELLVSEQHRVQLFLPVALVKLLQSLKHSQVHLLLRIVAVLRTSNLGGDLSKGAFQVSQLLNKEHLHLLQRLLFLLQRLGDQVNFSLHLALSLPNRLHQRLPQSVDLRVHSELFGQFALLPVSLL